MSRKTDTVYALKGKKENAHFRSVYCCDWLRWNKFSRHNGKTVKDYIVTGGLDELVKIWHLHDNKFHLSRVLRGHNMAVVSVSICQNTAVLVSASMDSHLIYWDVLTGKRFAEVNCGSNVWKAVISPDGYDVATGGSSGVVGLYRTYSTDTNNKKTLNTHSDFITSLAWSPNCQHIVTGSSAGKICVIEVKVWLLIHTIEAHTHAIRDMAVGGHNSVITASKDGYVKMYNILTEHCEGELKHDECVESVCFTPDETGLVSGAMDGTVRIIDCKFQLQVIHTFKEHSHSVTGVCFAKKGIYLLSVSKDRSINYYDCLPKGD